MGKPFDPTKPVQTRDGRKARIICMDRKSTDGMIVALVEYGPDRSHAGDEQILCVYLHGRYLNSDRETLDDLVNVPERRSEWQRVFKSGTAHQKRHLSVEKMVDYPCDKASIIGYNEYLFEDDDLIDVKFHRELPKE